MSDDDQDGDVILQFATIDQIADELKRRYGSALVVVSGEERGNPDCDGTHLLYRGGVMTGIGLAEFAKFRLLSTDVVVREEDDEDE
jgi:hypothetical protein